MYLQISHVITSSYVFTDISRNHF